MNEILELLTYALAVSIVINFTHLAFQDGHLLSWLHALLEKIFRNKLKKNIWRNDKGLLHIAKPVYACATCMPSLWSMPLLLILVWWKVFFVSIFASVISTLLTDKLFDK